MVGDVGWENSLINSNYSTPPKKVGRNCQEDLDTNENSDFFLRKLLLGNVRLCHNYLLHFQELTNK